MSATAEKIHTRCSSCQVKMRVPASAAGRRAKCPRCHEPFTVVAEIDPASHSMAQSVSSLTPVSDEKITFYCEHCDKKLRVTAAAAGKRVRCKGCGGVAIVPATPGVEDEGYALTAPPTPPVPPAVPQDDIGGDEDDLLASLAEGEAMASTTSEAGRCPECGKLLEAGAKVCIGCGYNLITRSKMSTEFGEHVEGGRAKGKGAKLGEAAAVVAGFGGPLMFGVIGSAVGAAIGAAIWYGLAAATDIERAGWPGRSAGWPASV